MARGAQGAVWWTAAAVVLLAAPARAQEGGPWMVRAEGGLMGIHGDDEGPAGLLRVSREVEKGGRLAVDLGVALSSYGSLEGGLEWRPCPGCRVRPFLGAGAGVMAEDDFGGWLVRANAGFEVPLGPRLVARVAGQLGRHGGQQGPHLVTFGLGYRFGRR
jgi:hypothetical protein